MFTCVTVTFTEYKGFYSSHSKITRNNIDVPSIVGKILPLQITPLLLYTEQPQVHNRVQFGKDNAAVTLELAANQQTGVVYNVSVVPQVDFEFIHSTVVQLRLAYNVEYNASIVRTLCERYTTIKNLKLSYGEPCTTVQYESLHSTLTTSNTF